MLNNKLAKAVRLAIAFGGASAAVFTANVSAAEEEKSAEEVERIEVTGSRIKRVDLESVSPITVISKADIEMSGDTSVAEVMRNSALNTFGSFRGQSGYGSGAAASSEVNLRGLGSGATLVLIDGRRMPGAGYDGGATADLSMIPMSIVERIEILRDGASAIYGADAVAGVINIITKKEYDGVSVGFGLEQPNVSGGDVTRYEFSAGATGEKGSIVFVAEHESRGEVADNEVTGFDNGYSSYSPVPRAWFDEGGSAYNDEFCEILPNTKKETFSATSSRCGYAYSNVTWLFGASQKDSVMTKLTYELSDNVEFTSRLSAIKSHTQTRYAPTPVSTNALTMSADNKYNPWGKSLEIGLRTATQGNRDSETTKATYEALFGLNGMLDVGAGLDWRINYQYTSASEFVTNRNLVNDMVIQRAINDEELDVFNVEGRDLNGWLDHVNSVYAQANHTGLYESDQIRHIVDGDIATEIFSNDFITIAGVVGFEYSNLDFTQISDPESGLGNISGGSGGDDVYASREKQSYFTELNFMLPANFEVKAAVRYDGYDLEGDVGEQIEKASFSDTVSQLGVSWRPVDSVLLRASWGEAFKTPTMKDMFASRSFGFPSAYDTYYCDTLKNPAGDTAYCNKADAPQHKTWNGGNPTLKPENSESLTAGVVWNVTDDLSLEFSYYSFDYTNKIEDLSLSKIIALDNASGGNSANVTRGANQQIQEIQGGKANIAGVKTNGFDITAKYNLETGFGDFGFNLEASRVGKYEENDGETATDYAGDVFYPQLRGNFTTDWSMGDFAAAWRILYIGKQDNEIFTSYEPIDAYTKHNLQFTYHVMEGMKATLGINNLFDKEAPEHTPGSWRSSDVGMYDPLGRTYTLNFKASF